jgi:hypothetical protein
VTDTLEELHGPTNGVVELPHRLIWQAKALRRFNLDDRYERGRMYEVVLREAARLDELRTWIDAKSLVVLWPDLYLPRGVRRAWEERHPALTRSRAAA